MYVLYIIIITFLRLLTLSRRSITSRIIKMVVERGKSLNFFFFFMVDSNIAFRSCEVTDSSSLYAMFLVRLRFFCSLSH